MSAHRLSAGSAGSPTSRIQDHTLSWTDDLPVCYLSGVGFSTNQIYKEDGFRREEHEFEDRSIHISQNGVSLYGVFDGHDGSHTANFAAQRMPVEIFLDQPSLKDTTDDEAVKKILHQAFTSVEKGFFDSIDDALAEKAKLLLQVPEGMTQYVDIYHQYPEIYKQLQTVEAEISGGTAAVVAVIFNSKLYIANVGCSRALLCKVDQEGVLRVMQLSVDHDLNNQEELLRLQQLGIDVENLKQTGKIGSQICTRAIGNYSLKAGYRDIEAFRQAKSPPIQAVPEVTCGYDVGSDFKGFLILMSYGLYKSLEDATGNEHVNKEIASMTASEFAVQTTLNGVAQGVVDHIVRIHHDTYTTATDHRKQLCQKRKDITLLVRNFDYPLPNAINSPVASGKTHPLGINTANIPYIDDTIVTNTNMDQPLSVIIPPFNMKTPPLAKRKFFLPNTHTNTYTQTNRSTTYTSSTDESTQSGDTTLFQKRSKVRHELKLNEHGQIEAYVDFSEFYDAISKMSDAEKSAFEADMVPLPDCEPILEEQEFTQSPDA